MSENNKEKDKKGEIKLIRGRRIRFDQGQERAHGRV